MNNLNFVNLQHLLVKNIKTLFLVAFLAALLSFGISFLLKEKYKSKSVVYPVNMYQNSDESNSEQLLQYLLSDDVRDQLASEFNLYSHYNIDTINTKGGKALFNYAFQENVVISPTLYESIEISVKDEDPYLARSINRRLVELTNSLIQKNKKGVVAQYLENSVRVLNKADLELDSINARIVAIKNQYDIIDEKHQGKYVSKEVVKGGKLSESLLKQSEGLKQKTSELRILEGKAKAMLKSYGEMKLIHDKYLMDAKGNIDFVLHVSKANLPDKRCYPVRWIIVLVSSSSALLLAVIFILLKNRSNQKTA
jgi:capsular polysaccharide biosynthesis protein